MQSICQVICWNMMNWICCSEFGTSLFILWSLPRVNDLTVTTATFTRWDESNCWHTTSNYWRLSFQMLPIILLCLHHHGSELEGRVYSLLVDIIGSNRIYFCYSQLLHISRMVVVRSFTGDVILDLTSIWLKSQVYIAWKFHKVSLGGWEESCWVSTAWESWVRCLHWYYILPLVLTSHFIWTKSKADPFQMKTVEMESLEMKKKVEISWSQ